MAMAVDIDAVGGLVGGVIIIMIVVSIIGSVGVAIERSNWLYALMPLGWLIFGFPVLWIMLAEKIGNEWDGDRRPWVIITSVLGIVLSALVFLAILGCIACIDN